MKRSISALSHISLFLFSSITFDAAEKRRSLSTLVQGADKYLRAAWARAGKWEILLFQNCVGSHSWKWVARLDMHSSTKSNTQCIAIIPSIKHKHVHLNTVNQQQKHLLHSQLAFTASIHFSLTYIEQT